MASPSATAIEVLLGHPDVHEPIGERLGERSESRHAGDVGRQGDHLGASPADLEDRVAERARLLEQSRIDGGGGRAHADASSCRATSSHSSSPTRTKWFRSRFTIIGTPWPSVVRHTIALGTSATTRACSKTVDERADVVAVDVGGPPPEGAVLVRERLDLDHEVPVRLRAVHVHDVDQVPEPLVPGEHGGLPGRALLRLAVGGEAEDPRGPALQPVADGEAGGDAEAVRERAPGQLDQVGVGFVGGHDQRGAVSAIGVEVMTLEVTGLSERSPEPDRVVPRGEDQPVRFRPTVDRVVSHLRQE